MTSNKISSASSNSKYDTYNKKRVLKPVSFHAANEPDLLEKANQVNFGVWIKKLLSIFSVDEIKRQTEGDIESINSLDNKQDCPKVVDFEMHQPTEVESKQSARRKEIVNLIENNYEPFEIATMLKKGEIPISLTSIEKAIEEGYFDLEEYLESKGKKIVDVSTKEEIEQVYSQEYSW